jgi:hypothetical protein
MGQGPDTLVHLAKEDLILRQPFITRVHVSSTRSGRTKFRVYWRAVDGTKMPGQSKEAAMLTILLATCETALQAFQAAENPIDSDLLADLKRMVERTRAELETLAR